MEGALKAIKTRVKPPGSNDEKDRSMTKNVRRSVMQSLNVTSQSLLGGSSCFFGLR